MVKTYRKGTLKVGRVIDSAHKVDIRRLFMMKESLKFNFTFDITYLYFNYVFNFKSKYILTNISM